MNETVNPASNGNGADARQFVLQQLFIKDLSFEAPNAPATLQGATGEPDVKLNLRHSAKALEGDAWEVVLHVSVHAEVDGKTLKATVRPGSARVALRASAPWKLPLGTLVTVREVRNDGNEGKVLASVPAVDPKDAAYLPKGLQ